MLQSIQPYAQSYAEAISRVTGIDVEIVDSHMVRIAGTGVYAEGVGSSLAEAGEIYKEVMRTRDTVLIESPRSHKICLRCPDRVYCREHLSLSTPVVNEGVVLGVIGLVCFNAQERQQVLASRDSYMAFIALLADALARKVEDGRRLEQATELLDLLLHVVNVNQQGIVIFDAEGRPTYISTAARQWLGAEGAEALRLSSLQRTGDSLSDMEEFELTLPDGSHVTLMGQLASPQERLTLVQSDTAHDEVPGAAESSAATATPIVPSSTSPTVTLFSFDLPTRLAQRVGHLSAGGGGSNGAGFDGLIGQSPAILAVKEKAAKVALSTSTVLIAGESGTGKELMARAIHQTGTRCDAPFVAINCGAIPDTLLESELFGYVGGAFTGASGKGRMGRFELAQGGIIFLDEISTMPLYLQVKLLRVLQERKITRLGSNRLVDIDVRIVSASNDDLWACTQQHTFREDLFYRLNVIQLNMPPLRERHGDIPILADYFLGKYCTLFQKRKPPFPRNLLAHLENYTWPGNVRELEHVLEYAVNMMPDGGPLRVDCLPQRLWKKPQKSAPAASAPAVVTSAASPAADAPPPIEPLHILERRAIDAALARFGNSTQGKKQAAAALGLSVATLYRKLHAFSK